MFAITQMYHVFPNINNRSRFKIKFNVSKIDGLCGVFAGGKLISSSKSQDDAFWAYYYTLSRCLSASSGVILEEYYDPRIDSFYVNKIKELILENK